MRNRRGLPLYQPRGWGRLHEADAPAPAAAPPAGQPQPAAGVDMAAVRKVMSTWHRNFGHQVNDPQFPNQLMALVSNPKTGPQALALFQKNPLQFFNQAWQKSGKQGQLPKPQFQADDQYQAGKAGRGDQYIDQIQQQTNTLGGKVKQLAGMMPGSQGATAFVQATDALSKVIFAIKKTQQQQGGGQ